MKSIFKEILMLEERAKQIVLEADRECRMLDKQMEDELTDYEIDVLHRAKRMAKEQKDEIIKKAKAEVERLEIETEAEIVQMQKNYEEIKNSIIQNALRSIIY